MKRLKAILSQSTLQFGFNLNPFRWQRLGGIRRGRAEYLIFFDFGPVFFDLNLDWYDDSIHIRRYLSD